MEEWALNMVIEDYSLDYLLDLKGEWYINKWPTDLSRALDYFREQWMVHADLHSGNIMVDKNGNIYIIDFGRVRFTR
jgi:Ser/Thr protein kinase RdoA (MazF antagonist)